MTTSSKRRSAVGTRRQFAGCTIDGDQYDILAAWAEREDRSLSQVLRWALQDWLVRHTPWRPAGREEAPIVEKKKRPLGA